MKKLISYVVMIIILLSTAMPVLYGDSKISFKDLVVKEKKHWAYDTIMKLANAKVIGGMPDGNYKPDLSITREQFVKLLVEALGLEKTSRVSFDDIDNSWAREYIETAVKEGIIIPSEVGRSFRPTDPLTRLDMAYMVGRALKIEAFKVWMPSKYPYVDNSDQMVTKLYTEYLMNGTIMNDGLRYFEGTRDMSRAEAAVVIDRVMQYHKDEKGYRAAKKTEFVNSLVKAEKDAEFEKFMSSPEASKYVSTDYIKVENGVVIFKEFGSWDTGDLILNSTTIKDLNKRVYNTVRDLVKLARRDGFYVSVWFNPNVTGVIITYSDMHVKDGSIVLGSKIADVMIFMTPNNGDPLHKNITFWWDLGILWDFNYATISSMEDIAKLNFTMPQYTDGVYAMFKGIYGDVDGNALADYAIKEYRYEYTNPLEQERINKSLIKINGYNIGNYNFEGHQINFITDIKK